MELGYVLIIISTKMCFHPCTKFIGELAKASILRWSFDEVMTRMGNGGVIMSQYGNTYVQDVACWGALNTFISFWPIDVTGPPAMLILSLHPVNERRRYKVTSSAIGWTQTKNQPSPTAMVNSNWGHLSQC